jgi:hypothetical protein
MEQNNNQINTRSSLNSKRETSDAVYERLGDTFFDKINFISYPYSDLGDGGVYGASRGTTQTGNYITDSRLIDTTGGKYLDPSRESRMRCNFYLRSADKLDGYILSPAILDSESLGTISSLSSLRAYVGVKILEGKLYVASKQNNQDEELYTTGIDLGSSTFSETFTLEINYRLTATEVLINGSVIGTFASNMGYRDRQTVTFYPLFSPGKSTDGTQVNIVIENYQFIQARNS